MMEKGVEMKGKKTKTRLDQLLVQKDLEDTRSKAQALIMAGSVLVEGDVVDKAGTSFVSDVDIKLKEDMPYVGRGGLKLEKALKEFNIDVGNKICLDVGASTGGFTDCLLQNGASKVYCVDVGYGQLHWKLRNDERVINFERENFRHFDISKIQDPIDVCVMDVSFISVKKLIPKILEILSGPLDLRALGPQEETKDPRTQEPKVLIILIKPQFEVGPEKVGKGGIVRDEGLRKQVVEDVKKFIVDFCRDDPLWSSATIQITESPIKGADGNVEYLLMVRGSE